MSDDDKSTHEINAKLPPGFGTMIFNSEGKWPQDAMLGGYNKIISKEDLKAIGDNSEWGVPLAVKSMDKYFNKYKKCFGGEKGAVVVMDSISDSATAAIVSPPGGGWGHIGQVLAAQLAEVISAACASGIDKLLLDSAESFSKSRVNDDNVTIQQYLHWAEFLVLHAGCETPGGCNPNFEARHCRCVYDAFAASAMDGAIQAINQLDAGAEPEDVSITHTNQPALDHEVLHMTRAEYRKVLAGFPYENANFEQFCKCFPYLRRDKCDEIFNDLPAATHYLITMPPIKVRGVLHAAYWNAKTRSLKLNAAQPPHEKWLKCAYESWCAEYAKRHWDSDLVNSQTVSSAHIVEFVLMTGPGMECHQMTVLATLKRSMTDFISDVAAAKGIPSLEHAIIFATTDKVEAYEMTYRNTTVWSVPYCGSCGGWITTGTSRCACCGYDTGCVQVNDWTIPLPSAIFDLVELDLHHLFTLRHHELVTFQRREAVTRVGNVIVADMADAMEKALNLVDDPELRAMVRKAVVAPQLVLPMNTGLDKQARALDYITDHEHDDEA